MFSCSAIQALPHLMFSKYACSRAPCSEAGKLKLAFRPTISFGCLGFLSSFLKQMTDSLWHFSATPGLDFFLRWFFGVVFNVSDGPNDSSEIGGESNREIVSCRAMRASVRARGLVA